jgi:hypothetical protein
MSRKTSAAIAVIGIDIGKNVNAGVKPGHWGGAKAGQFAVGVDRDVPRPARRRWPGFRSGADAAFRRR